MKDAFGLVPDPAKRRRPTLALGSVDLFLAVPAATVLPTCLLSVWLPECSCLASQPRPQRGLPRASAATFVAGGDSEEAFEAEPPGGGGRRGCRRTDAAVRGGEDPEGGEDGVEAGGVGGDAGGDGGDRDAGGPGAGGEGAEDGGDDEDPRRRGGGSRRGRVRSWAWAASTASPWAAQWSPRAPQKPARSRIVVARSLGGGEGERNLGGALGREGVARRSGRYPGQRRRARPAVPTPQRGPRRAAGGWCRRPARRSPRSRSRIQASWAVRTGESPPSELGGEARQHPGVRRRQVGPGRRS